MNVGIATLPRGALERPTIQATHRLGQKRGSLARPGQVHVASSAKNAVVILPGLGNNAADYDELTGILTDEHGHPAVEVLRVSRLDWFRNAAGLTDPKY